MLNPINNAIVAFVKILPKSIVKIFAKKYVAGENLKEAVEEVKKLNAKGIITTMDVLGEAIENKEEAIAAKDECIELLETIDKEKLDANVSIKPTQLGLGIDTDFAHDLIEEIVKKAGELNNFIRIDMEDSPFTDKTIDLFLKLREKYSNVGIVLQSYLRRTLDDVKMLNQKGGHYRLCKGIYVEPEEIAFKGKQEVRDNFMVSLEQMFKDGNYVGIATHDKYLIDESYKLIKKYQLPNEKFEFQMLYGVTEHLRDRVKDDGYKMRVYIPFGEHWYAYSIRRLQENPAMAWHITKSILSFR